MNLAEKSCQFRHEKKKKFSPFNFDGGIFLKNFEKFNEFRKK